MSPNHQKIIDKVRECIDIGNRLYGMQMPYFQVGFNLKGRVAGWAIAKTVPGRGRVYSVRFNNDMITRGCEKTLDDMINDTVPHEVAHCFCFANPELGSNHDSGWARVCRALGGTGGRTHSNEVVFGKGTTYEYITDRGHKVRLNERRHSLVQAGGMLTYRKNMGTVTRACAYSIVGVQGRSLKTPVERTPVSNVPQPTTTRITVTGTGPELLRRLFPEPAPMVVAPAAKPVQAAQPAAESKAAVSRRIMLSGYRGGHSYETIIAAMQAANGYDRQLARGTFKANADKVGIPASFYS